MEEAKEWREAKAENNEKDKHRRPRGRSRSRGLKRKALFARLKHRKTEQTSKRHHERGKDQTHAKRGRKCFCVCRSPRGPRLTVEKQGNERRRNKKKDEGEEDEEEKMTGRTVCAAVALEEGVYAVERKREATLRGEARWRNGGKKGSKKLCRLHFFQRRLTGYYTGDTDAVGAREFLTGACTRN